MAKEEKVEFEGEVVEALPNAMFKVQLDNGHEVLGHVAGKMRRFRIRILPGDRVRVEVSPYDLNRARIVYRHRYRAPASRPVPGGRSTMGERSLIAAIEAALGRRRVRASCAGSATTAPWCGAAATPPSPSTSWSTARTSASAT